MSEASGIPSWAVAGRRVVCIKRGKWTPAGHPRSASVVPIFRGVYTIRKVVVIAAGTYLALQEITGMDCFSLSRFRPAVEDSDELGIETKLYRQKGRKSKAPVRESERA